MAKRKRCPHCEELIDEQDLTFTWKDVPMHQDCLDNAHESSYPSTVIHFSPDNEPIVTKFSDFLIINETASDFESHLPTPIKNERWVKTDGWRGYTDWDFLEGYVEYSQGWVTGYPDETTRRKADISELYQDLIDGKIAPPCDIYWIFGTTSNVFSTATSIVIHQDDKETIDNWLIKLGKSEKWVHNCLG